MTIDIDQAEDQGVQPPQGDCDECGEPIPPGDPWTTNANRGAGVLALRRRARGPPGRRD